MRLSHKSSKISVRFDEPNLIAAAGMVPLLAIAQDTGLEGLVADRVRIEAKTGVFAPVKVGCLVAGMAGGADTIDGMGVLRHGAMGEVFGGVRAPSTLGSFLRSFEFGSVAQLRGVAREFLAALCGRAGLLPGAGTLAFVDMDSTQRRVYGHKKQGAAFGHTKIASKTVMVRGLNALAATVSTPLSAPLIAATRLRGGSANTARGAASLLAEALGTAREAGCTGTLLARTASGGCDASVCRTARRAGARFSVTARLDPAVNRSIAAIPEDAWVSIRYPQAIFDEQTQAWVSDAQVAETAHTAFASVKGEAITARLIVRRVKDLSAEAAAGQGELCCAWRYHAVFTDSPFAMLQAEAQHRDHAVVEQVFADWSDGPMAHMPSGRFQANSAWLTMAAMAHNLTRAAGRLASAAHAKARGSTVRADLIHVPARIARTGRGLLILHTPEGWHRQAACQRLFDAACGPPARTA